MAQSNINIWNQQKKRASVPGPRANVTIEAAFAIPFFLFGILCLIYLMEIQAIRGSIHTAALNAAKSAAEEAAETPVLNTAYIESDIINLIGPERLERSIVEGGMTGIRCTKSYLSPLTGEIQISLEYRMRLPFSSFGNPSVKYTEEIKVKGWTGYEKGAADTEEDTIVYITDTGTVYHEDYQCSYLQLSIKLVSYDSLSELRNKSGGKYHRCEKCVHGEPPAGVYITEDGNKYHSSVNCSGLKRTVRAVKKSEVGGRTGCSRCTR